MNASQRSKKSEAETTALVEAEVAEAIASCGGDVRATLMANAYLEAEIERLTEAISTGFAGPMRKAPQRIMKI